jgi:3D (Asp-Asp-Asp) domain-containing protein
VALLRYVLKKLLKFCKKYRVKKDVKVRKYNVAIHVLFWALTVFLLFITLLYLFYECDGFSIIYSGTDKADNGETEDIVVREVVEVKKEVEWYYFLASGYSANDPSQGTNNTTATGKEIRQGMVAVDPNVIPLGTRIEIKKMGIFIAEDTGGKIKGNRIDIYFDSREEAKKFGMRGVWINIIDKDTYDVADLSENEQYISRYMSR